MSVSDQDVSSMPNHQIHFDDGIYFLLSLITTLFNHGSQFDAHQLLNIFLPFSKNPDIDLGRICTIQPTKQHLPLMGDLLRFVFAMSRPVNALMKDTNEPTPHMDACQGKAFFDVISGYNINSAKGRKEVFKLLFDKKKVHWVVYMKPLKNLTHCSLMKQRYLTVVQNKFVPYTNNNVTLFFIF